MIDYFICRVMVKNIIITILATKNDMYDIFCPMTYGETLEPKPQFIKHNN